MIERFFQTYDKHRRRLGTLDEFFTFYNEERPHMSLDWDNPETPAGAFDSTHDTGTSVYNG